MTRQDQTGNHLEKELNQEPREQEVKVTKVEITILWWLEFKTMPVDLGIFHRFVWWIYPGYQIPETHLGKFPDPTEFQGWKVNFRTEVCSKAKDPRLAMQWIKEIEIAKSIDDLITSRSIWGKPISQITMNWMRWWRLHWKSFTIGRLTSDRKSVSKSSVLRITTDFLRKRQIAFMIYDHFRSTGSYGGIQGLWDLFSIRLYNDDIQDFDQRWEQAVLLTSDPRADKILEGLYKSKLQDPSQLQSMMALYKQEILRRGGEPDYHRLRMCVTLHIDQTLRNKNFKIQNEMVERGAVWKGFREINHSLRGE